MPYVLQKVFKHCFKVEYHYEFRSGLSIETVCYISHQRDPSDVYIHAVWFTIWQIPLGCVSPHSELIWHEFNIKPCQEEIKACRSTRTIMLSLFSIGIKVSNAVQESVILALTSLSISPDIIINLIAVNFFCGANTQCYFYQKSERALSL